MTRLAWVTDPHLNFVKSLTGRRQFYHKINTYDPTHVVFTGDIAEAPSICDIMYEVKKFVKAPTYIVLGNHDFYRGAIDDVRSEIAVSSTAIKYLPYQGVVPLTNSTCLIGVDGFYDGQYGDYWYSRVVMSDFKLISDLHGLNKDGLFAKLSKIANVEAAKAESLLRQAFKDYETVYFATHVPPFKEATWHMGKHSDDAWLPFFSCKAIGSVLLRLCKERPDRQVKVLCGHTHGAGTFQALPNLHVETGAARYGRPTVYKVIDL